MTAFALDYESWLELSVEDKKLVAKMPKFKDQVLNFEQLSSQDTIDFSNQEVFEVEGFGTLSLAAIALLAHSRLPRKEEWVGTNKKTGKAYHYAATPKLYAAVSPLWETLERIQAGKVAQGLEFSLDYKALADFIEASLA